MNTIKLKMFILNLKHYLSLIYMKLAHKLFESITVSIKNP